MKTFGNKLVSYVMRFVNTKGVTALKDGMLSILPLTVAGSIFLIIGSIPSEAINTAIASEFLVRMDRTVYASVCRNFCYYGIGSVFYNRLFICKIR